MRPVTTLISTFALALHFTLGCCLHHGECQEMALALRAEGDESEALEGDCHEHEHDGCPASGQKHAPHGGCRSVPCAAVRVLKTQAPEISQGVVQHAVLPASFFALADGHAMGELLHMCDRPGEPPRLNLLHQVFLI